MNAMGRTTYQVISSLMPMHIVDLLETVQIRNNHTKLMTASPCPIFFIGDALVPTTPIKQACQSVMFRQLQESLLGLAKGQFSPLSFSDILMRAEHHQGRTFVSPGKHFPPVKHPNPMPVFVFHAAFKFVIVKFPLEMPFQQLVATFQIIGVGKSRPGFYGNRGNLIEGVADDLRPAFVKNGFTCFDIPFPGANVSAVKNALKAPLLFL